MPTHRTTEPDPLRGSIDLLVLKALSLEPMHGWGIGARIQQMSRGRLDVNQGSLYPALQRLEHRGDIESEWRTTGAPVNLAVPQVQAGDDQREDGGRARGGSRVSGRD